MRYLDAQTLGRLSSLQLRVRAVVEGTMAGLHRSPHHGASVEFAEHKEYSPGDDVKRIDWKAFAKFDRHYVRQYEDETELRAYLLLDSSGSMAYGKPLSKHEYGCVLVASLAFLLAKQGDQPGCIAYSDRLLSYLPPRARGGYTAEIVRQLEALSPQGSTDIATALDPLIEQMGKRALVFVVSDLFEHGSSTMKLLSQLRARAHHVICLHVLHDDELNFPFTRTTVFESMESERRRLVDPRGVREEYLAAINAFIERARRDCAERRVAYSQVSTSQPLDAVLVKLLASRGRYR